MSSDPVFHVLEKLEGSITLAFSYQAEDVVALYLLRQHLKRPFSVFTLDTQKHFEESLVFHKEVETFFNMAIERFSPSDTETQSLLSDWNMDEWGMRASLENRKHCCEIRKVRPLARALSGKTAWVTGLRAAQSVTRAHLNEIEYDESFHLLKFNPLAKWSEEEVFDAIKKNNLPLHPLYNEGFRSIGCQPCTRAIEPHEDIRAGRWWWENPEHKECGLHTRKRHG